MNETEEYSDWHPAPVGRLQPTASSAVLSPYDQSSVGEFARQLLFLAAIPLLIWFASSIFAVRHGILSTTAAAILFASLCSARGPKVFRVGLLALMTINVLSIVVNTEYVSIGEPKNKASDVPSVILLVCLAAALAFEGGGWLASCSKTVRLKIAAWGLFAIPALIYIAGIPIFEWLWESIEGDEKKIALRDPDWNFGHELTYRTSKFAIFGVFTYAGACIGSFLNVVAYSVPRGEPIGFRDSKCQLCDSKISRIDNLPIFSYINLGAQCRNCSAPIPARYLIAELVGATIFGSLFLYELVTGGANVPAMRTLHQGILWVILYPKWPVIGIYLFHTLLMCCVLVLAMIERDRQSIRPTLAVALTSMFLLAPLLYWPIQPVSVTEHLPISLELSPWIDQSLRIVIGGFAGAVIGFAISAFFDDAIPLSLFRLAMILTGIVLGWQALVQITMLFVVAWLVIQLWPKLTAASQRPSSVLLAVIMLHHPFWKTFSSWWP